MDILLDVVRVDAKPDYTLLLEFANGKKRVFDKSNHGIGDACLRLALPSLITANATGAKPSPPPLEATDHVQADAIVLVNNRHSDIENLDFLLQMNRG